MSKPGANTSKFDKTKAGRATDWTASPQLAARAITDGIPLGRDLTPQERLAIAVAACRPTHLLTITSEQLTREEALHAFGLLKRQWENVRGYPWIYIGTCPIATSGSAGQHIHLLLWEYVHMNTFRPRIENLGFGRVQVKQIKPKEGEDQFMAALGIAAYVLGQEESVLGTTNHANNQARAKGQRAYLMPQRPRLAARKPKLLEATDSARSTTTTDDQLLAALPKFIETVLGGV